MGSGWQVRVTTGSVLLYFCVLSVICEYLFFFNFCCWEEGRERDMEGEEAYVCIFRSFPVFGFIWCVAKLHGM